MERSVAQGRAPDDRPDRPGRGPEAPLRSFSIAAVLVAAALVIYAVVDTPRQYNHFVWQAEAFLDGESAIRYPVEDGPDGPGNAMFNDVDDRPMHGTPPGRGRIPFPPLPAVVLLPFVAIWGLATDQQLIASIIGALDVGLAWWMLGRLGARTPVRLAATVFFAWGTVFWYAAQLGTTWYFAHIVALALLFPAIGLAVGADPRARREAGTAVPDEAGTAVHPAAAPDAPPVTDGPASGGTGRWRSGAWRRADARRWIDPRHWIDRTQLLAGLLFGLAATARLPVLFAAPFFILVGGGGSWPRRAVSAGLGAVIPVGALLVYNLATTGHLFHPSYEHLYQLEAWGYPSLGYNPEWAIEDPRYLPGNLALMLFGGPAVFPDSIPAALGAYGELCTDPGAVRRLFDPDCPIALPRDIGMSVLLTSPAYLLALPALRLVRRSRLVVGAVIAVVLVAVVNLMHFSQGWVQFGYRFSNDFVPFALLLAAVGLHRRGGVGVLAIALIVVSILVNLWGVYWGNALGW